MNCYNVGGWTDSLALMKERDEAMAELAACRHDFRRITDFYDESPVRVYQGMERIAREALERIDAARKGEGGT